jgi:indolepyruvate ferredoxin oxidoreductase, alpha subunit
VSGLPTARCSGARELDCIVSGDIGCYTLGVLPPFSAMDTCVCMGASIGVGLGLRHVLPEDQARRVVSVIGDSTFVHSGLTGIAEMVYNPPATGPSGDDPRQRHDRHDRPAGASRDRTLLDHSTTNKISFEGIARAMGVQNVQVVDTTDKRPLAQGRHRELLAKPETSLLITRQPCVLAAPKIRFYDKAAAESLNSTAARHAC